MFFLFKEAIEGASEFQLCRKDCRLHSTVSSKRHLNSEAF